MEFLVGVQLPVGEVFELLVVVAVVESLVVETVLLLVAVLAYHQLAVIQAKRQGVAPYLVGRPVVKREGRALPGLLKKPRVPSESILAHQRRRW